MGKTIHIGDRVRCLINGHLGTVFGREDGSRLSKDEVGRLGINMPIGGEGLVYYVRYDEPIPPPGIHWKVVLPEEQLELVC